MENVWETVIAPLLFVIVVFGLLGFIFYLIWKCLWKDSNNSNRHTSNRHTSSDETEQETEVVQLENLERDRDE